jgi:anti-sigma regulatory factor (Ser/Thr protein kinase)
MSAVSEIRLRNDLAELRRLGREVENFAAAHHLSSGLIHAFDLSLVEWVTNIISYGYAEPGEHWIEIRLAAAGDQVRAEVVDDGREFNPLAHPPADTSVPLENRPIGGLGIHMIRKLMDQVEYRREGGRNMVTMIKAQPVSNQ